MEDHHKQESEEYFEDYTVKRQLKTFIYLPVLHKYKLTLSEYAVIDSIATLARNPDYEYWCVAPKRTIAGVLRINKRTAFRAIAKGIEKGLLEYSEDKVKRDDSKIRTTKLWLMETEFSAKKREKTYTKIPTTYEIEESPQNDKKSLQNDKLSSEERQKVALSATNCHPILLILLINLFILLREKKFLFLNQ